MIRLGILAPMAALCIGMLNNSPAYARFEDGAAIPGRAVDASKFQSFAEVARLTYLSPWKKDDPFDPASKFIPQYRALRINDLFELVINHFKNMGGREKDMSDDWPFAVRSRRIMTDSANFKPTRSVKWLHPRGVCSTAKWIIDEESPATGLFKKGTEVPAIIRISTGTHDSERLVPDTNEIASRLFGMAVKIFHSTDKEEPALTSNILTLDRYGFVRTKRPFALQAEPGDGGLWYTNVAPVEWGSGSAADVAKGKILSTALDMFDDPNWARPVYVTATFDDQGRRVANPVVPYEIRFIPSFPRPVDAENGADKQYEDFRYEILEMEPEVGQFDIVLQQLNEDEPTPYAKKIGRLVLTHHNDSGPVLTGNCDLWLAFHHSPNQWKEDYTVYKE